MELAWLMIWSPSLGIGMAWLYSCTFLSVILVLFPVALHLSHTVIVVAQCDISLAMTNTNTNAKYEMSARQEWVNIE